MNDDIVWLLCKLFMKAASPSIADFISPSVIDDDRLFDKQYKRENNRIKTIFLISDEWNGTQTNGGA